MNGKSLSKKSKWLPDMNPVFCIALSGMFIALEIILERLLDFEAGQDSRYSFAFASRALTGYFLGPVYGAVIGFISDFLGAVIKFGSSNPLLSITAVIRGFFYGLFLFEKINLKRVISAALSVELFCSLLINSYILTLMYGGTFKARFLLRLPQAVILILVQIPVIMLLSKYLIPALKKIVSGYSEQAIKNVNSVILTGSHLGLKRVRAFGELLGSPENSLKIIHVAGTNGKGSTSNMLADILIASGRKTGIFNSPYLKTAQEYFNINGKLISDADFKKLTDELTEIIRENSSNPEFEAPTEFEFYTCAALKYFADNNCDFVVLEAGMGGEDDATNFISAPELAVITNIGLDHEKYLGKTIKEIAEKKAGIIKKGSSLVIYPSSEEAVGVINAKAEETGVPSVAADFSRLKSFLPTDLLTRAVEYTTAVGNTYNFVLNTPAEYQARNAAVALEAVEMLRSRGVIIQNTAIRDGMASFSMPARFEIISRKPLIVADGGHNPQCTEALLETYNDLTEGKQSIVLTGVMRDKDYTEMYKALSAIASEFIVCAPDMERALKPAELSDFLGKFGKPVTQAETPAKAVEIAKKKLSEDGNLLITGTFYMMDEIRKAFGF